MSNNQFDIYDRLLHLLGFLLGDLAEPLALGAHYLALAITDELLVILNREKSLKLSIDYPDSHFSWI